LRLWALQRDSIHQRLRVQSEYSEKELSELRLWREQVSQLICERLSQFRLSTSVEDSSQHEFKNRNDRPSDTSHDNVKSLSAKELHIKHHRALDISEIIDAILQLAGPEALSAAWNVSSTFRRSVRSVIGSRHGKSFWESHLDTPVEYNRYLDASTASSIQPSMEELEKFQSDAPDVVQSLCDGSMASGLMMLPKFGYLPARWRQLVDGPADLLSALDDFDQFQDRYFGYNYGITHRVGPIPPSPHLHWLDLSQFKLNTFFAHLFGQRLKHDRSDKSTGKCEIDLNPATSPRNLLIDHRIVSSGLIIFMDSMFVTQPPCKVIGIYHNRDNSSPVVFERMGCFNSLVSNLELLGRVRNDEGIRIGELIAALKSYAPRVLSAWTERVEQLQSKVATGHWTDDIWNVPGQPRITLLLDNAAMQVDTFDELEFSQSPDNPWRDANTILHSTFCEHITRPFLLLADEFREIRQGEWMPEELWEPAKSTVRAAINWWR
jgi:hypothetical protein